MYRAKSNIACGSKFFLAGNEYTKKEIEGLDVTDFEVVTGKEDVEEKPKSMTIKSLKAKK